MDGSDWNPVVQFMSEPAEFDPCPSEEPYEFTAPISSFQVPTPPPSHDGSPIVEEHEDEFVSISTTFRPDLNNDSISPDVIFMTTDAVFFYVHTCVLLSASQNNLNALLPPPSPNRKQQHGSIINVPEASAVFNVVLHAMYNMPCAHYAPSFSILASAVVALDAYGVHLQSRIAPSQPLFHLLLSQAAQCPLELYALASRYDLYDLAVATSPHLLSIPLVTLTDEMSECIGATYLKRLIFLHFGRGEALKRLLGAPPRTHEAMPWCDSTQQKKLTRAWALASASLVWDANPGLSTCTIESALNPLIEHLSCSLCKSALKERIQELVIQWSAVKKTI